MALRVLVAILLIVSSPSWADGPRRPAPLTVYVFGDSLSDNGNFTVLHPEVFGATRPPPWDPARASNGPIWVDHLSRFLRTPILPEVEGGTNYAVSGATISPDAPLSAWADVSGYAQVERFLAEHGSADPDAVYVVWLGGNDVDPPAAQTERAFATLVELVRRLHDAGARKFLVPNLLDLGEVPLLKELAPPEFLAAISEMCALYNARLQDLPRLFPDARFRISDVERLRAYVTTHPQAFGLTNTTGACYEAYTTGALCADPDRYFYWDGIHPTSRAHELLAGLFTLDLVLSGELRRAPAGR